MVRIATAVFAMTVVFSTARAAWTCRCEDSQHHVAGGINNACNGLSDNWDTRDCNIFGKNCDYCRYGPDGDYDRESESTLKSWCGQQSYVSNNLGSRSYELRCYRD